MKYILFEFEVYHIYSVFKRDAFKARHNKTINEPSQVGLELETKRGSSARLIFFNELKT